jgi:hypothetical protein
MRLKTSSLLFVLVFLLPVIAGAVNETDFEVQSTEDIINLCMTSPDDPLYHQAINFCHGYLVGAYHYYEAISSGPKGIQLVCLSDPLPSPSATLGREGRRDPVPIFNGKVAVQTIKNED